MDQNQARKRAARHFERSHYGGCGPGGTFGDAAPPSPDMVLMYGRIGKTGRSRFLRAFIFWYILSRLNTRTSSPGPNEGCAWVWCSGGSMLLANACSGSYQNVLRHSEKSGVFILRYLDLMVYVRNNVLETTSFRKLGKIPASLYYDIWTSWCIPYVVETECLVKMRPVSTFLYCEQMQLSHGRLTPAKNGIRIYAGLNLFSVKSEIETPHCHVS